MATIYFITGNTGKSHTANFLRHRLSNCGITIQQRVQPLDEIQGTLAEISRRKALQAYHQTQRPLIVEDSGLVIDALGGFPGPYFKHFMKSVKLSGLLRLMKAQQNRTVRFEGVVTYIDAYGSLSQFHSTYPDAYLLRVPSKVISPFQWGEIWQAYHSNEKGKALSEFTQEEFQNFQLEYSAIAHFARWLMKQSAQNTVSV